MRYEIRRVATSSHHNGFSLVEVLIVVAITGILAAIVVPTAKGYLGEVSVKAALWEIISMYSDAKRKAAVDGRDYALCFAPASGRISLASDKGHDSHWNTVDDVIEKTFLLSQKSSALSFGHGSRGPVPTLAASDDGISFGSNVCVCNAETNGSAGTIYVQSSLGPAMALVINSTNTGYSIWRWDGSAWKKM
jgi:prepilin-type N-terminal cleavage/methylation domain-containing protein